MVRKTHPGFGYVAGIACLIVSIAFAIHTFVNYHDWVKLEVSAQNQNCQTEIHSKSSGIGPNRHRKTETISKCDVQISYEYHGKIYTDILHDIDHTDGEKLTRYIDPKNPQISDDISWKYIIILVFGVMGFVNIITGYYGVKDKRKREKEEKERKEKEEIERKEKIKQERIERKEKKKEEKNKIKMNKNKNKSK